MPKKLAVFEDLKIGDSTEKTIHITEKAVQAYSELTGDTNFIHVDPVLAAETPIRERVAHGGLIMGYVGALIGTEMPGQGCMVLECGFKCTRPVKLESTIHIRAMVTSLNTVERTGITTADIELTCSISYRDKPKEAVTGKIVVYVPRRKIIK